MSRDLTAAMKAELATDELRLFFLFFFDFPAAPCYFWSGYGDLVYASNTYKGAGELLKISEVTETTDSRVDTVSITVSGIPTDMFDAVSLSGFHGREASIKTGILSDAGSIVADPYLLFQGIMDSDSEVTDNKTSEITIVCTNALADLLRPREWRYTHEHQQLLHPGQNDKGFEFVPQMRDLVLRWGKPSNAS